MVIINGIVMGKGMSMGISMGMGMKYSPLGRYGYGYGIYRYL